MPATPVFVGFTGHRRLADPASTAAALRRALDEIAAHTHARLVGVSSLASGADTLFAEELARRDAPWLLLLPLPLDTFRDDFEPDEWARAEALLPRALSTHIEPPAEHRDHAYLECGHRTVDESDVLIAVWNGAPSAGLGGTGDVVAYARARQKPLVLVHEPSGKIESERLDRLPRLSPSAKTSSPATGRAAADALLDAADRRARSLRPLATNLGLLLIAAHQLATAIAIAALVWLGLAIVQSTATWLKLALLAAALVTPFLLRRAHHGWLQARLRAEIIRSALQLWPLPQPEQTFAALRLPGFESLQRHLLLLRLEDRDAAQPLESARAHYLAHRVGNQENYFATQTAHARRQLTRLRRAAFACTAAAIACGLSLATHVPDWGAAYPVIKFAALTLPLATATLVAAALALDYGRRAARYRELAAFLADARIRIENARSPSALHRAALEIERTLLFEVWEWYSLARYAFGSH
jgi:hypothetical protein